MAYSAKQAEKDKKRFTTMAEKAEKRGDSVMAGLYRVEAGNCMARVGMKKAHKPNLGPYSAENPCHCLHCGEPREHWTNKCRPRKT
jgi:hypothetical protein